jgi:hypothetical protein
MKVVLGFLYRAEQRVREEIFHIVQPKVTELYPWDGVIVEDSGHQRFNRAATRNLIVKKAHEMGADVVVVCDADSIPEPHQLRMAIDQAYHTGGMYIPFTKVTVIPHKGVYRSYQDYRSATELYAYGPSCGGIFVCRPSTWAYVGGMDERIEGWGYEDQIFIVALETFLGGYTCIDGLLYNFMHPRGHDHFNEPGNAELRDKYHAVINKPAEVRRLSVGSNDFCADEGTPDATSRLWRGVRSLSNG